MEINKYRLGSKLSYNFPGYQEQAFKSGLMRQQHDTAQQSLFDTESGLDFEYNEIDDEFASPIINQLQDQIGTVSKQLATQGYNPRLQNDLIALKREYTKQTGAHGRLGQISKNYTDMQNQWGEVEKKYRAEKMPEKYIQSAKNKFLGTYQGAFDDNGKYQSFSPGAVTGYKDVAKDAVDYFKNSEFSTDQVAAAMPNIIPMRQIDPTTGATWIGFAIKDPGAPGASNAKQIAAGMSEKARQWTNKDTDLGLSAELQGLTNDDIVKTLYNTATMMTGSRGGKSPSVRLQGSVYKPNKDDGKSSGTMGGRSVQSRTVPIRNTELFKNTGDVSKALKSTESNYTTSAANNLLTDVFDPNIIPKDLQDKNISNPTEFYNGIKNKRRIANNTMIDLRHDSSSQEYQNAKYTYDKLGDIKKTIDNNIETKLDVENSDLAAPVYSFNPMMKSYSTVTSNLNAYVNNLPLTELEFVGGPLRGVESGKKLKGKKEYELLKEGGLKITGVGAERDSGMFYMIKDKEGTEHMVRFKDPTTANNILMASDFERPDLFTVEKNKNIKFSGDKVYGVPSVDKLEFKVNNSKTPEGYRGYAIEGKTFADVYDPIIQKLSADLEKSNPELTPEEIDSLIIGKLGLDRVVWDDEFVTSDKSFILSYNAILKALKNKR